ncbi:hypothetical protein [Mesorhizobium sp.]|uniref:hypothetical protein n=1 Tax=Mesorhizobium sp. TaxID=1871066 RepID=UPI000FE90B34|nr:hypothetical protein [Mesorhizobium sp.]RWA97846.1 MAG: hypothetical protein EOQ33_29850 [Mesorhizobium sp.]
MFSPIRPVGIGDLLVVKQQITGYEKSEVAFIENVLAGEKHLREVRRLETTEITVTTEHERITEEERDLQSTERFEMQREAEQQASVDGRLSSRAYGGLVEFSNAAGSSPQASLQESQREASTYGREVTSRALSKVTEKMRTEVTRRTLREFEEKSSHSFDNETGQNRSGIYQWVDKIYHNRVYSYGKRLLYDLIIPEPGAFLIEVFARAHSEGRELVKPGPWTLSPNQVSEDTYTHLVSKYQATGIQPPPPLFKTVCKAFGGTPAHMTGVPEKVELDLPDGYEAKSGYIRLASSPFNDPPQKSLDMGGRPCIQIVVGNCDPALCRSVFSFTAAPENGVGNDSIAKPLSFQLTFYKATGRLPIAVTSWYIVSYAFIIDVVVQRSPTLYRQWQARTYDALLQAYLRQKADYEERLANVLSALRAGAIGQTSDQKRKLELDELKKSCISMITNQYYDVLFGASVGVSYQADPVTGASLPYPQVKMPVAFLLGSFVRFFEHAFEWQHLMYSLYSYFWGRKNQWMRKVPIEDSDEAFADFLKAGAARVVIPVRLGFERAVVHFLETGVVWAGAGPPEINDLMYLPIIAEIQEANEAAGTPEPYGEPWTVKVPSKLIALRADDTLPAWKEVGGEWVPA